MRELVLDDRPRSSTSFAVEAALLALRSQHPKAEVGILPRLSAVQCSAVSAQAVIGLVSLLGPRVRVIVIPEVTDGGCRYLPLTYDRTATVSSDTSREVWARYDALFSGCLRSLHGGLHYLNLHGVEVAREDLLTIATMPNLRELWIQPMASWNLDKSLAAPVLPFPKLKNLSIQIDDSDSIRSCSAFLARLRPPRLECLFLLEYVGVDTAQELRGFWATVTAMGASRTLRCLMLQFTMEGPTFPDVIRFSDFKPLLSLQNLDTLWIILRDANRGTVEFKDRDFEVVAHSWPKLVDFQLLVETGASDEPYEGPNVLPTMNALMALAKHPKLWSIGLTFDTSVAVVDWPTPNRRVQDLCVDGSPLRTSAITRVADFLSSLFPNVSCVEFERYFSGEDAWGVFELTFDAHQESADSDSEWDEEEEEEIAGA